MREPLPHVRLQAEQIGGLVEFYRHLFQEIAMSLGGMISSLVKRNRYNLTY
jgi:hypothetical protein